MRKGESGSLVVFADKIVKTETGLLGEETKRAIPFMKGYSVFNCEQIDGLPNHFYGTATRLDPAERIERAESFLHAIKADSHPQRVSVSANAGRRFEPC